MRDDLKTVSVVIPHFNSTDTLRRALTSVLRQSMRPNEVILVDDCSDACSLSQLRKILEKPCYRRIKLVVHASNQGAGASRNTGILASKGDYVALLDSDDVWHPDLISRQVSVLERYQADLVCAKFARYKHEFWKANAAPEFDVKKLTLFDFIIRNPVKTPTVVFRRLMELRFPMHLRRCEDYYVWINLVKNNIKIVFNNDVLAYGFKHEVGGGGLTGDIYLMHHAYRVCIKELYEKKVLSFLGYIMAFNVELVKYQFRRIMTYYRKNIKSR